MASDLVIQEVLLSGLALNYTFHGLSAGTEYTISVTAATDAGLGTQATITATTTTLESLEVAISAPGMVQNITYCLIPCQIYTCINTLQFIIYTSFNAVSVSMLSTLSVAVIVLAVALCMRWVVIVPQCLYGTQQPYVHVHTVNNT